MITYNLFRGEKNISYLSLLESGMASGTAEGEKKYRHSVSLCMA